MSKQQLEWIRDPHGLAAYEKTFTVGRNYRGEHENRRLLGRVHYEYLTGYGVGYIVKTTSWDATGIPVGSETEGKQIIEAMYALED